MNEEVARALRACKRLIDHESAEFLTARWSAKDADAMDTFPEQLYRDRLAAMEKALKSVQERAVGSDVNVVEDFLRDTLSAIGDFPENIYFISEIRRKLKSTTQ